MSLESKKLIIKIDGRQHNEDKNIDYDTEMSKYLKNENYQIVRFWNNDIWNNIENVCEELMQLLK